MRDILEKLPSNAAGRDPSDSSLVIFMARVWMKRQWMRRALRQSSLNWIASRRGRQNALIDVIAHVQLLGPNTLFNFYADADLHNADQEIANIDQGGLSLPDRDYYIKDTPRWRRCASTGRICDEGVHAVGTIAGAGGSSAQTVLRMETALAKASMDRTLRRDPKNLDHKMTREQAMALAPNFHLDRFFTASNTPSFDELNVANPDFFKEVNGVIASEPLDAWKTYVSWHLLNGSAPWLSKPFVDAQFKMPQYLTGQTENQPRWKRCVELVDNAMGEALGQKYVELTFGADGKRAC